MYNEAHRPVFLSTTFPLPQNTFVFGECIPKVLITIQIIIHKGHISSQRSFIKEG